MFRPVNRMPTTCWFVLSRVSSRSLLVSFMLPEGFSSASSELAATRTSTVVGVGMNSMTLIWRDWINVLKSATPLVVPLSVIVKLNVSGPPNTFAAARNCIPWIWASVYAPGVTIVEPSDNTRSPNVDEGTDVTE